MKGNNPFSLYNKSILITGASSGIGQATAIECSKMGANLIITGRDKLRLVSTFESLEGKNHKMFTGDLTSSESMDDLLNSFSKIDGIVLCAGIAKLTPVQFSTRKNMDTIFNINFFSTCELIRQLYKKKKIENGGSIVIIDSIAGITEFTYGHAIYGSAKAALQSFAKYCALEFASRKIRVNCICPGMVETPLIHSGTLTDEQLQEDENRYPCGRYGQPEDIANGAIYLLSNASSWVTGTNLFIDGGISLV